MFWRRKRKPVKILYIVPDDEDDEDAGMAEGLWAFSLGEQLYQLQNIPVFAEHLNVEDIVHCVEPTDTQPVIQEVVKRSGNRTLRVIFTEDADDETCVDVIWELTQRGIAHEQAASKNYMFNIAPNDDYAWAQDFLRAKDQEGILWLYEQPDE